MCQPLNNEFIACSVMTFIAVENDLGLKFLIIPKKSCFYYFMNLLALISLCFASWSSNGARLVGRSIFRSNNLHSKSPDFGQTFVQDSEQVKPMSRTFNKDEMVKQDNGDFIKSAKEKVLTTRVCTNSFQLFDDDEISPYDRED